MARQTIFTGHIPSEEADLIEYLLRLNDPEGIKSGIQRLCQHIENGLWPRNEQLFRRELRGLLLDHNVTVRRWTYKGFALLGDENDVQNLVRQMPFETDLENLTWMMSAILGLSESTQAMEICKDAGVEFSTSMALSAYLYGEKAWHRIGPEIPQVNIDTADPLTLKWCALLAGYGRAPENLMHPKIGNGQLLGELNHYPQSEVAEYSVWALWRAPEFSRQNLKIEIHDLPSKEENVRRWIYRLLSLDPAYLEEEADLFQQLTEDPKAKAREGLALGLRGVAVQKLQRHIMRWLDRESELGIKEALLEHLALSPEMDRDLSTFLKQIYIKAEADGGLRRRLRSAVAGRHQTLFQSFSRWDAVQRSAMTDPSLFEDNSRQNGTMIVNQKNEFKGNINAQNLSIGGNASVGAQAGRDVNSQNVAAGDIRARANTAIAELSRSDPETAAVLKQVVQAATEDGIAGTEHEGALIEAATVVAKQPTTDNKATLLDKLKLTEAGLNLTTAVAATLPVIIAAVGAIL